MLTLGTPAGWLRVTSGAASSGSEASFRLRRVVPAGRYLFRCRLPSAIRVVVWLAFAAAMIVAASVSLRFRQTAREQASRGRSRMRRRHVLVRCASTFEASLGNSANGQQPGPGGGVIH